MRTRAPDHPSQVRDMVCVYDTGCGKRKRSDAKGVTTRSMTAPVVEYISTKLYKLRNHQNKHPRRKHQFVHHKERDCCCWKLFPGIAKSITEGAKRSHPSTTAMHCEECSAHKGKTIYHCNSNKKKGGSIYCHIKYHNKIPCKKYLEVQEALKALKEKNYCRCCSGKPL